MKDMIINADGEVIDVCLLSRLYHNINGEFKLDVINRESTIVQLPYIFVEVFSSLAG